MKVHQTLESFVADGTDVYMYIGPIDRVGYQRICDVLGQKKSRRAKALLYLVTSGGDPNAGYRIARALIHHYDAKNFRVAIPSQCKSAGTLLCIGAHSLVFFDQGELGPLDVQFQKTDEIFQQSSGLDILRGMTYLRQEALSCFSEYLIEINGGSGLSTRTASEIASSLVIGLFEPMFGQIDPIRLGEMNAALHIAHEYGTRLNEKSKGLKAGSLAKLTHDYPTHGFVIDRAEARALFERVEAPTEPEREMGDAVMHFVKNTTANALPLVMDLIDFVNSVLPKEKVNGKPDDDAEAATTAEASKGNGAGHPSAAGADAAPVADREQPPVASQQENG